MTKSERAALLRRWPLPWKLENYPGVSKNVILRAANGSWINESYGTLHREFLTLVEDLLNEKICLIPAETQAPLSRSRDHASSTNAAKSVAPLVDRLQNEVFTCFKHYGEMTDDDLRRIYWSVFGGKYAESTLRKRRTELTQMGFLKIAGRRQNDNGREVNTYDVVPKYRAGIPKARLLKK